MENSNKPASVRVEELVSIRELQNQLANLFPSRGSLEWELRQNRRDYVDQGALFIIAGRLLTHPETFKCVALSIGARKAGRGA